MRKIVTIGLWIDDDHLPLEQQGGKEMSDEEILKDIESELGYCYHSFEIIKYESAVISNEKSTAYRPGNLLLNGAR